MKVKFILIQITVIDGQLFYEGLHKHFTHILFAKDLLYFSNHFILINYY